MHTLFYHMVSQYSPFDVRGLFKAINRYLAVQHHLLTGLHARCFWHPHLRHLRNGAVSLGRLACQVIRPRFLPG